MQVEIKENVIPKHDKREAYVPMYPVVNPIGTLGFIPVPKVGSSTMLRALTHENCWTQQKYVPDHCKLFSLVRHPINRWISGMAEHWNPILTRNGNDLTPLKNTSFEQLLIDSFEDRHTQPQSWNFDNYSNVKFFKFDNLGHMWKWLGYKEPEIHERNHLTMGGLQNEIWEIISKKARFKLIIELYREDMQLWKGAI